MFGALILRRGWILPSRQERRRRPTRFRPAFSSSGTEALERRDVPALVEGHPLIFAAKNFVSATINVVNNQVVAVYTLDPAAPAGTTRQVGLALYSIGTLFTPPTDQVRIANLQGVLSKANPTLTLTIPLPMSGNLKCVQADAYVGGPETAGLILDNENNGRLNNALLAALVDCSTVEGRLQGLSPGYYKNHLGAFEALGLSRTTTVKDLFGAFGAFGGPNNPYASLANSTLVEALDFNGGPTLADKARILLRQAVTAYLNASSPSINYAYSAFEVISRVHTALASRDASQILALADLFDTANNAHGVDLGLPNTNSGDKK